MATTKDTRIHIRASSDQVKRLAKAAELLDMTDSDLIRKAIDEKLEKLSRRYPELQREAA